MTYNYILYERLIIIKKNMLVQCLHRWPIIYTTLCESYIYYMERGIQPNLQRQLVYYDVTDGGCGRMSATASVSELTSDALYIRPHQINFMNDGFSAKWSERANFKKKNFKKLIFLKNGASDVAFFFSSKKET